MRNHQRLLVALLSALALVAATVATATATAPSAAAGSSQLTLWNHSGPQDHDTYWNPTLNQPADYTSPVDYAGGRAYMKLQVTSKPSDLRVKAQVCFWRHTEAKKFKYETCGSAPVLIFENEGTYWADLGAIDKWWKKNGTFDWSKPVSLGRIMLKDMASGKLLLDKSCGAACYTGDDLADHVPVHMTAQLVLVGKGSALSPPKSWRPDCPVAWSATCAVPVSNTTPDDDTDPPKESGSDTSTKSPSPKTPQPDESRLFVTDEIRSGPADYEFGLPDGDALMVGDWNGDGRDGFAVRDGSTLTQHDHLGNELRTVNYGASFDTDYVVGDWNGDGADTLAVRRGNVFHLTDSPTATSGFAQVGYGRPGDEVFVGDWDGNGTDTFAVRRGNIIHVRNSMTPGPADVVFAYGRAGDEVLIGDWNRDGTDTFAVRRRNVIFIRNDFNTGVAHDVIGYGKATDTLLVGDFDGDGVDTFAVRRSG